MTTKQLDQAIKMHGQGLTWHVIAAYFKTTYRTLRRRLKNYEQATN